MTVKTTFESSMLELAKKCNVHETFRDFLTVTLCAFVRNPSVTLSMEAYSRYSEKDIKDMFPKILHHLMIEITERRGSEFGNDVLGEFYETHITKREEKRILSWKECQKVFPSHEIGLEIILKHWPIGLLDVGCRSGRIMLATAGKNNPQFELMGVEYDFDFIMMTTLNLFFNFHNKSEVLWVDQSNGYTFKESYHISILPMGIVRNLDPKKSHAWEHYQLYLQAKKARVSSQV
ncbi:MAG: hypothetical protein Q8M15_02065 [Bacteroidota bacterium]|nr:hypothetical protein [Bacteroidota bacterium]